MSPVDAAAPAASALIADVGAFTLTVLAGVIVSLLTLWLAGRQRATQENQAESLRRQAVLAAIGCELRCNRMATRGQLEAANAHILIGALTSVAFEAHAGVAGNHRSRKRRYGLRALRHGRQGAGGDPGAGAARRPHRPAGSQGLD